MNKLKRYEEAQRTVGNLRKSINDLGEGGGSKELNRARSALAVVEDSLQAAHGEAKRLEDPLVRVARGEPFTKELRKALRADG